MAKTKIEEKEILESANKKYCFVITPIGNIGSDIYLKANGLIDAVLIPVLSGLGYKVEAAHHINSSGSISNQIIERLLEADLVVANLTGLNPNVMYELAVRHAKRLPVISLAENGTKLPFDIQAERTLFYEDTMRGVEILKPKLKDAVNAINFDEENHDNPIYRAAKSQVMQQVVTSDTESYILDRMDQISMQLNIFLNENRKQALLNLEKPSEFRIVIYGDEPNEEEKNYILTLANNFKFGMVYGNGYPNSKFVFRTQSESRGISFLNEIMKKFPKFQGHVEG